MDKIIDFMFRLFATIFFGMLFIAMFKLFDLIITL